jgi:endonuclease G
MPRPCPKHSICLIYHPQVPGFNRGIWSKVEDQVRKWTLEYDSLYIATGPVFRNNLGVIGGNKVTVPGYYYKVIYSPKKKEMIGLVLPNASSSESIGKFVVPVDSVEVLTGIDFFPELADKIENELERNVDILTWMETGTERALASMAKATYAKSNIKSVQCKGIAKSTGKRCRTMTTNSNGYCNAHHAQASNGQKARIPIIPEILK